MVKIDLQRDEQRRQNLTRVDLERLKRKEDLQVAKNNAVTSILQDTLIAKAKKMEVLNEAAMKRQ